MIDDMVLGVWYQEPCVAEVGFFAFSNVNSPVMQHSLTCLPFAALPLFTTLFSYPPTNRGHGVPTERCFSYPPPPQLIGAMVSVLLNGVSFHRNVICGNIERDCR